MGVKTTIARGTVIAGEINAEGDVELLGCTVQGNIVAGGSVSADENTVVIGDVKGENISLDGKIKGNVTVENEAKFQQKSILAGNVTAKSIAMCRGVQIQGLVNIPLGEKEADITFDAYFCNM